MTAKEVACGVGIAERTYRAWEAGRAIQGEPYLALSDLFDLSVHELLSGEKPVTADARVAVDQIEKELGKLKSALHRLGQSESRSFGGQAALRRTIGVPVNGFNRSRK